MLSARRRAGAPRAGRAAALRGGLGCGNGRHPRDDARAVTARLHVAAGGTLLAVRCWCHAAGGMLLAPRCWRYAAGGTLLAVRCWCHAAGGTLLAVRCWRHAAGGMLLAVR
eukprot:357556-Chlamydomonas_euryale.AAC.1